MDRNEWAVRYKDTSPEQTVERIIRLLDEVGLETEYRQAEVDVEGCYSSRVTLKGKGLSLIGVNGKGTTEAFCRASAYGELMERLQNRSFGTMPYWNSSHFDRGKEDPSRPVYFVKGEEQGDHLHVVKKRFAETVQPMPLFGKSSMDIVEDLLEKTAPGEKPGYSTAPFWSVKEKREVLLPVERIKMLCGSNGMAAGNSLEEAIVQGISEIWERYVQRQFIENKIVPPSIPREVIARYPIVDRIIRRIEEQGRYKVFVMDASMGKGFPVVSGAIIDTERQTMGMKFGAHPDLGVAMERIFSEAMQGRRLENFSSINQPDYTPPDENRQRRWQNTVNLMKAGLGTVPAWMLYDEPDYPFREWPDTTELSNRELAQQMVEQLGEMAPDVYIRDVSFLGFPSVQIYAPGISEVSLMDVVGLKIELMHRTVQTIFRHLDQATDEQVRTVLRFALLQRGAVRENTINSISGIPFGRRMPFGKVSEALFLAVVCHYRLGNLADAAKLLEESSDHLSGYDHAAAMYIKARAQGGSHEEVGQVLRKLCSRAIAEKVLDDFADPAQVLTKIYPSCPGMQCDGCSIEDCYHRESEEFYRKLAQLEQENDPGVEGLRRLFD